MKHLALALASATAIGVATSAFAAEATRAWARKLK